MISTKLSTVDLNENKTTKMLTKLPFLFVQRVFWFCYFIEYKFDFCQWRVDSVKSLK